MRICEYLWLVFLVVWMLSAMRTKPVQTREGVSSRLSYTVLTVLGAYMMFSRQAPQPWLNTIILPDALWIQALGIVITALGIAFAIWARVHLGGNWSGSVTVKVGHQLVRTGPYRFVRHPIYSGMILASLGTALAQTHISGLVAVVLFYVGFKVKSKIEEQTMISTFGAEYSDYSRTTGAILPKLHF